MGLRGLTTVPGAESVDAKVALFQALILIGLKAVAEALEAEVSTSVPPSLRFTSVPARLPSITSGGGRANSVSILEAIAQFEELMGRKLQVEYVERNRVGDHICYISDLRRLKGDYPQWEITRSLDDIFQGLATTSGVREG